MTHLMQELLEITEQCHLFHHTKEELSFLNRFVNVLQQNPVEDDDIEISSLNISLNRQKFLHEVVHANPAPNFNFELLNDCVVQNDLIWSKNATLDWFLFYVFNRRFGWPDLEEGGNLKVCCLHSIDKWRPSVRNEELYFKPKIMSALDLIVLWIFHQPVNLMSLKMFHSAIRLAELYPVTRLQLSINAMDILKDHFEEIDEEHFVSVQELLLVIMTDMWSQIRSSGASRLGPVVERLSLKHLQCLFMNLTQLCRADGQAWQVIDGAINAIHVIIKRFHLITVDPNDLPNQRRRNQCCYQEIKIGQHILAHLPNFIVNEMHSLVYILTSNPQLTIRETTIKAFVACLVRCHEIESENAFIEVYKRLKGVSDQDLNPDLDLSSSWSSAEMDAYTAESLIRLITILYKRIRNYQSHAQNWDFLHKTFDRYLMHSASSVRLATSNLYKCVVSRNLDSPLIVKNILWCLIRDWQIDQNILFEKVEEFFDPSSRKNKLPDEKNSNIWRWREGCLLVYELLCKLLIKNHCIHAFGSSKQFDDEPRPATAVSLTFSNHSATLMLHDEQSDWSMLSLQTANETSRYGLNKHSACNSAIGDNCGSEIPREVESETIPNLDNESILAKKGISNSHPSLDLGDCQLEDNSILSNNEDSNNNTNYKRSQNCLHDPTSIKHNCSSFLIHVKEVERLQTDSSSRSNTGIDQCLPHFHSLISKMFYSCVTSMVDPQWEVRRIANQTFPCLGELILWSDPELLSDLISTYLVCEPRLMTYSCLLLLRDTMRHAAKLRSPSFSALSGQKKEIRVSIDKFLCVIDNQMHIWLQSCLHYLQRSESLDCITLLAYQPSLLAQIHDPNYSSSQQLPILKTLLSVFQRIDMLCSFPQINNRINIYTGLILYSGHNEICDSASALRFGMELLMLIKEDLLELIQQSAPNNCAMLLSLSSILLKWICPVLKFNPQKGNETVKIILKIVSSVASCATIGRSTIPNIDREHLQSLGYQILQESANILLSRSLVDPNLMRNLLDSLYNIISGLSLEPSTFLKEILVLVPLSGSEPLSQSTDRSRRKSCLPSMSPNCSDPSLTSLNERMRNSATKFSALSSNANQCNRRKSLDFLIEEDHLDNLSRNISSISEYCEDKKLQLLSSEAHTPGVKETDSCSSSNEEVSEREDYTERPPTSTGITDGSPPCDPEMEEENLQQTEDFKCNNDDANSYGDFSSSESIIEDEGSDWDSSSSNDEDPCGPDKTSMSGDLKVTHMMVNLIKRITELCQDSLLVDGGRLSRGEIAQLRSIVNSDWLI